MTKLIVDRRPHESLQAASIRRLATEVERATAEARDAAADALRAAWSPREQRDAIAHRARAAERRAVGAALHLAHVAKGPVAEKALAQATKAQAHLAAAMPRSVDRRTR